MQKGETIFAQAQADEQQQKIVTNTIIITESMQLRRIDRLCNMHVIDSMYGKNNLNQCFFINIIFNNSNYY